MAIRCRVRTADVWLRKNPTQFIMVKDKVINVFVNRKTLPPAVTDYKALQRKRGTVLNKTPQRLPKANSVLESQKKKAMLQCCQNVAAESRSGHPKEPAVTLVSRALWKRNFGRHNWMLLGMVIEH